jgi:nicotinate dehydrogenase subunit A
MITKKLRLTVNGINHSLNIDPDTPLLYVLRNHLQMNGPKYGCGLGQCGCCMVLLENQIALSCILPVKSIEDLEVTTLSGLTDNDDTLNPVQQAFLEEQAAQCGYCTNGMILTAVSLLDRNPQPDDLEIREAFQINLCRCGTQSRVIRAVRKASERILSGM